MDVKKLYPNIDTKMPLKYIIEKIYEKTSDYFPKNNNEHGQIIFPPKKIFEKNFDEILHKFTAFECLSGYFRQKTGANIWVEKIRMARKQKNFSLFTLC